MEGTQSSPTPSPPSTSTYYAPTPDLEPFSTYRLRIAQLLPTLNLRDFSITAIQHSPFYPNRVYALHSPSESYILRVPLQPSGVSVENDVALLRHLAHRLPGLTPRVVAYDSTRANALGAPFSVQTRMRGTSLDNVWGQMGQEERMGIVEQVVEVLGKIEAVGFGVAGTFEEAGSAAAVPGIKPLATAGGGMQIGRQGGADLHAFLSCHLQAWVHKAEPGEEFFALAAVGRLQGILDALRREGAFSCSTPIVLHHWDLEPRNIMVEHQEGAAWRISGVIDWDDALAFPRPLARRPLAWIWRNGDGDSFTCNLHEDFRTKDEGLTDEAKALKARFDAKAEELLDGYLEDAYGHGLLLRRVWMLARGPGEMWSCELLAKVLRDWDRRPAVF
ncbi:MAG: hypothetical protein Q9195_006592 [Heterodermia aff. obscurata]